MKSIKFNHYFFKSILLILPLMQIINIFYTKNNWTRTLLSDLFQALAAVYAAYLLYLVVKELSHISDESARAWKTIFISSVLWALGMISFMYVEIILDIPPYPGFPDLFFIMVYPIFIFGIAKLPVDNNLRQKKIVTVIDITAFLSVASLFIWQFNLKYLFESISLEITDDVLTSILYTVLDIALLTIIFYKLTQNLGKGKHFIPTFYLVIGGLFLIAADIFQGDASAEGVFSSGSIIDLGWLLFSIFCGLAALKLKSYLSKDDKQPFVNNDTTAFWIFGISYFWIIIIFFVLIWSLLNHQTVDLFFIIIGSVGAIVIAISRQILTLKENTQLVKELRLAQSILELKVEERTKRIKEQSELLELSEKKFRGIFNSSFQYMGLLSPEGDLLEANNASLDLIGLSRDNVLGKKFWETPWCNYSVESAQIIRSAITKSAQGQFVSFEFYHLDKANHKVFVDFSLKPILDENGKVIFIIPEGRNLTERKLAEEKIVTLLHRLNDIIEFIPDPVFVIDVDGKVIAWNRAIEELTGVKKENILGKGNYEYAFPFWGENRPILIDLLNLSNETLESTYEYIRREGEKLIAESHIPKMKNGAEVHLWGTAAPLFDKTGARFGSIEIIRDITYLKKKEDELNKYKIHLEDLIRERTEELNDVNKLLQEEVIKQKKSEERVREALAKEKELNELKTRFISIASHEFRTPLATMYSSTELIELFHANNSEEKFLSQLDRIRNNIHYLTEIMDDILVISRADSGKINCLPQEVVIEEFMSDIVEDINILVDSKHSFEYLIQVPKENIVIDEKLFKIVLMNLISNAIKYTPDGGMIRLEVRKNEDHILFQIIDEGIGIPEKDMNHLFEPFHRAENVGSIHGTGLGLTIVKRYVELQNGTVSVISEQGKGTVFTVAIKNKINESSL